VADPIVPREYLLPYLLAGVEEEEAEGVLGEDTPLLPRFGDPGK
jgi:hypothetical protein